MFKFFRHSVEFGVLHSALQQLNRKVNDMQLDLSKIVSAAAHSQGAVDHLIAQFKAISDELKDVSQKLADALAGNGDVAAVQAQLDSVADSIDSEAAAAEAAAPVAATAPAAPVVTG